MRGWARANGLPIPRGLRVLVPRNGAQCRALIRLIEVKAWGPGAASGLWTRRLALLVKPPTTSRARALAIARKEIGVTENPPNSNDGARVRVYQQTTGEYRQPWCASFVTWCFKQAGTPLAGFNRAYVPSWVEAARAGRSGLSVVAWGDAIPGDVVNFDWQQDGVPDHDGILASRVDSAGNFTSVEGNTSPTSQSNGGAVMLRKRNRRDVTCFIRVS